MICTLQLQVPIFKIKIESQFPPFLYPMQKKQGRESSEVIWFSAWDKERGGGLRFNFNYRLTHVII